MVFSNDPSLKTN